MVCLFFIDKSTILQAPETNDIHTQAYTMWMTEYRANMSNVASKARKRQKTPN